MKKIPLNSLVFLIDVDELQVAHLFPKHEFVSIVATSSAILGTAERPDLNIFFELELKRMIELKLSLGQRVVVDVPNMRRETRISLATAASNRGHSIFYIVDDLRIRRDLLRGDRVAEVVDLVDSQVEVVNQLPDENYFTNIQARGYSGVTVVADIHGMMNPMRNAISWAKSRNHFLLLLGDLIDYGKDTLEVMDEAYQLVTRGDAEILIGNHERKIFKYLSQMERSGASNVRLSAGNQVTIDRIDGLSQFDSYRWTCRFKALYNMMRNHRVAENFIFAHGAVLPEMWSINDIRLESHLEDVTLFGQVDDTAKRVAGFPNRVYNWVELLKPNQVAIVGHDIRSESKPFEQRNAQGGKAIFLDTGCGKGGHLSTVDIRFSSNPSRVENFNVH